MLTTHARILRLDRRRRALGDLAALLAGPHTITKTLGLCARCGCGVTQMNRVTVGGAVAMDVCHRCLLAARLNP